MLAGGGELDLLLRGAKSADTGEDKGGCGCETNGI
jgi:hypothetical protein